MKKLSLCCIYFEYNAMRKNVHDCDAEKNTTLDSWVSLKMKNYGVVIFL